MGDILHRKCHLKHITKEKRGRTTYVMIRLGRRRKQLMDELKWIIGYWKLKGEALDHTLWITRFGRGNGPVVRQTKEWYILKRTKLWTWTVLQHLCMHCGFRHVKSWNNCVIAKIVCNEHSVTVHCFDMNVWRGCVCCRWPARDLLQKVPYFLSYLHTHTHIYSSCHNSYIY